MNDLGFVDATPCIPRVRIVEAELFGHVWSRPTRNGPTGLSDHEWSIMLAAETMQWQGERVRPRFHIGPLLCSVRAWRDLEAKAWPDQPCWVPSIGSNDLGGLLVDEATVRLEDRRGPTFAALIEGKLDVIGGECREDSPSVILRAEARVRFTGIQVGGHFRIQRHNGSFEQVQDDRTVQQCREVLAHFHDPDEFTPRKDDEGGGCFFEFRG